MLPPSVSPRSVPSPTSLLRKYVQNRSWVPNMREREPSISTRTAVSDKGQQDSRAGRRFRRWRDTEGFHCNVDSDSALVVAQVWGGGQPRQGGRGRLGFGCLDDARLGPNSRCTKELQGLLQAQDRQHHSPFAPSPSRRVWDEAADLGRLFLGLDLVLRGGAQDRHSSCLPGL